MMRKYKGHRGSLVLRLAATGGMCITGFVLLGVIGFTLIKGLPNLSLDMFQWEYTTENASMMPAIVNTLIVTILAMAVAVPIGIFSAIYLVEYAGNGNKTVGVIRITTETLSGIPSIVYGLFGYLMFVVQLKLGYSILAGILTLAIMILPLVMRTTEEALKGVPVSFREGSFGLGAGRLRTIFRIVLPAAMPGILSGVILSIGRIVGETAALIYTAGTVAKIPQGILEPGRTLSVHMYALLSEGLYTKQAYATAVVLMIMVLAINGISNLIGRKVVKR